jgi:filamentous hemagglutinin
MISRFLKKIQAGGGSSVQAGGGEEVRETPTLVNHTQDDTQRTLTPAGQSLVSLAVVAATLLTGGTAAGALGITNAAGAAGLNAGVGSFVTQTAINTINADGDLGKALGNTSVKQIGVSAGAAALSAGLISHITPGVTPRLDSNFKAGAGAGTKLSAMGTTQSASYVDQATGQTVSRTWNSLDPSTQNVLKGAGKVLGVSLSAAQVTKVTNLAKATTKYETSGSSLLTKPEEQKLLPMSESLKAYGAHDKGPLGDPNDPFSVASTFRSGTYYEKIAETELFLYRDYGGAAKSDGRFWTLTPYGYH